MRRARECLSDEGDIDVRRGGQRDSRIGSPRVIGDQHRAAVLGLLLRFERRQPATADAKQNGETKEAADERSS